MERECALLAGELARRGWSTTIVTEQLGQGLPSDERDGPVRILRLRSSVPRSVFVQLGVALQLAVTLIRHRRHAEFAIVRTMTLPALVVGLLKRLRLIRFPTLVTAETGGGADDVIALSRRPLFRLSRWLVSGNDHLNGLVQTNVDHLRQLGFPLGRVTMIPNGIDTSAWASAPAPERIRRLLYLGRIEPAKGVFELVQAFAGVHARHPDVSLVFAGDGPSQSEVEGLCESLHLGSAVRFAGRVPYEDVGDLLMSVDCLVLPSYSEGMPLSVLEAAARRRALVVTDVGDIRATFGDSVRICPPGDADALERTLELAVSDGAPTTDYADVMRRVSIADVTGQLLETLLGQ